MPYLDPKGERDNSRAGDQVDLARHELLLRAKPFGVAGTDPAPARALRRPPDIPSGSERR